MKFNMQNKEFNKTRIAQISIGFFLCRGNHYPSALIGLV